MPELTNQKQNEETELINIQWQAPEFEKYEKGPGWFIIVGIIALAIFTVSILMKNFIFGIMIIFFLFVIFIYALKEPRIITFKIDGKGLSVDDKLYNFDELKSFWIFYEPPLTKELSIRSTRWTSPLIKIPLADQDPMAIREALINFIPEERQEPTAIDNITKRLRF